MEERKSSSSAETESLKRKRFDEIVPEDTQEETSDRKVSEGENGSTDEDDSEQRLEGRRDYKVTSDGVELKVQSIREKMELFNQHVRPATSGTTPI